MMLLTMLMLVALYCASVSAQSYPSRALRVIAFKDFATCGKLAQDIGFQPR